MNPHKATCIFCSTDDFAKDVDVELHKVGDQRNVIMHTACIKLHYVMHAGEVHNKCQVTCPYTV